MNDVEVVFDSWRAVFRSSPLYLCDLACAEVGPRFLFDSIVLSILGVILARSSGMIFGLVG